MIHMFACRSRRFHPFTPGDSHFSVLITIEMRILKKCLWGREHIIRLARINVFPDSFSSIAGEKRAHARFILISNGTQASKQNRDL